MNSWSRLGQRTLRSIKFCLFLFMSPFCCIYLFILTTASDSQFTFIWSLFFPLICVCFFLIEHLYHWILFPCVTLLWSHIFHVCTHGFKICSLAHLQQNIEGLFLKSMDFCALALLTPSSLFIFSLIFPF